MIDHNYEASETEYLEMEAVFAELNAEEDPATVTDLPEWASLVAGSAPTDAFWSLWRADKEAVKNKLTSHGYYIKKTAAGWRLRSKRRFAKCDFYYRDAALKQRISETDHWSEDAA